MVSFPRLFKVKALLFIVIIFYLYIANANEKLDSNEKFIESQISRSLKEFSKGDKNEAIRILENTISLHPHSIKARYILASFLLTTIKYNKDEKIINQKIADKALYELKYILHKQPGHIQARLHYAALLRQLGRNEDAVSQFSIAFKNRYVRTHPKFRYFVIDYELSLTAIGRIEDGLAEYNKSLSDTNYDEEIAWAYIKALSSQNKIAKIQSFIKKFESVKGFSFYLYGQACMELSIHELYKEAIGCYEDISNQHTLSAKQNRFVASEIQRIKAIIK